MANINDSSAQYPDLQTGNGVQTNGSTLRENVTNCKVRASEQERNPQAGTRAMEAASRIRTSDGKRVPGRWAVTAMQTRVCDSCLSYQKHQ
jgi:hypothetical protein